VSTKSRSVRSVPAGGKIGTRKDYLAELATVPLLIIDALSMRPT
jgi:hypothetical protein